MKSKNINQILGLAAVSLAFAACCGCSTFSDEACVKKALLRPLGQSYEEVFYAQAKNPEAPEDPSHIDSVPGEIAENIYRDITDSKSFAQQLGEFIVNNAEGKEK